MKRLVFIGSLFLLASLLGHQVVAGSPPGVLNALHRFTHGLALTLGALALLFAAVVLVDRITIRVFALCYWYREFARYLSHGTEFRAWLKERDA